MRNTNHPLNTVINRQVKAPTESRQQKQRNQGQISFQRKVPLSSIQVTSRALCFSRACPAFTRSVHSPSKRKKHQKTQYHNADKAESPEKACQESSENIQGAGCSNIAETVNDIADIRQIFQKLPKSQQRDEVLLEYVNRIPKPTFYDVSSTKGLSSTNSRHSCRATAPRPRRLALKSDPKWAARGWGSDLGRSPQK